MPKTAKAVFQIALWQKERVVAYSALASLQCKMCKQWHVHSVQPAFVRAACSQQHSRTPSSDMLHRWAFPSALTSDVGTLNVVAGSAVLAQGNLDNEGGHAPCNRN